MEDITAIGKPIQNDSIVTQIVNQITDAIIQGSLAPGDKLPTETALCSSMGVGRNSVREAIKILEAYGVVYIKRADGTFINDCYSQKMLDPMLYGILLQKNSLEEIIQLRQVLDIGVMQTIMPTITSSCLEPISRTLQTLITAVSANTINKKQVLQADIDFHMSIVNASHNNLLLSMYSYVDRITIPSRTNALTLALDTEERQRFIDLHQKLMDILAKQNYEEIETTVTEHYTFWKQTKEDSHE
ncbi:MAG: GntR family transcriptional regulator [Lachnospiraceae bacterium]